MKRRRAVFIKLIIGILVILVVLYTQLSKQQIRKSLNTTTPQNSSQATDDKEASSLDFPKPYAGISWKETLVQQPLYLHFQSDIGGRVPLTGVLLEGQVQQLNEKDTRVEDYYVLSFKQQGWVRKVLHAKGYELGILSTVIRGPICNEREMYTFVFMGYKENKVRLIKINSSILPEFPCMGEGGYGAGTPTVTPIPTPAVTYIKYTIFLSDPLSFDVIDKAAALNR